MVSEIKLDSSFPQAQFRMEGYAPPFRYDRNSHGGGKLKKNLDKGGKCGPLFVDLSKVFDCLQHDLLLQIF